PAQSAPPRDRQGGRRYASLRLLLRAGSSDRVEQKIDVRLEQPIGVEVPVRLEQRAPENGREHRRDDELRKVPERRLPKFSALHSSVDQSLQSLQPTRDDMFEIELSQLWMLVPFADQETGDD